MPRKPATNVTIKKYNYYRTTATIGKNPDGKPIRKQFYAKCKKDALAKREEYLAYIKQGLPPGFDKFIFGALFEEWYDNVHSPNLALSTVRRYSQEYRLRLSKTPLITMPVSDIKGIHIQRLYNSWVSQNIPHNSLRIIHGLLSGFFNYCIKIDMLVKNPLLSVKIPKIRRVDDPDKKQNLSNDEVVKVLDYARDNPGAFVFVFAIFTGLRQGETLALRHKDIKNGVIYVHKTLSYLAGDDGKYQTIISGVKTTKSRRAVPIFEDILPLLYAHIEYEKEKHKKCKIPFSGQSILFSSAICGYDSGRNLRKKLNSIYEKLDIEPTTFHGLRHTFCSALAQGGVNVKTTSELMGHSDIGTTLKIYTHIHEEEKRSGIATLGKVFKS